MDNPVEYTSLSLFTGYGGLETGLRIAGLDMRTRAYVEIEAFACANLVTKMEAGFMDAAPIWTDIKTFDGRSFRDRIHFVVGGYPCTPFSDAGKKACEADPRYLWPDIRRIVETVRPVWCFFENVSGHVGTGFSRIRAELRDMGFAVEAGLFTAAEVGADHRRTRLFILAYNASEFEWECLSRKDGGQISEFGKCNIEGLLPDTEDMQWVAVERCAEDGILRAFYPRIAGPGEEQFGWEPPRVVGNAGSGRFNRNVRRQSGQKSENRYKALGNATCERIDGGVERGQGGRREHPDDGRRIAESAVGRVFDDDPGGLGYAELCSTYDSRIDELRLLGNGVVPLQAAWAFLNLYEEMKENFR